MHSQVLVNAFRQRTSHVITRSPTVLGSSFSASQEKPLLLLVTHFLTMADASALPKRIARETERLIKDPVPGATATPFEDNLRYFNVSIDGPPDTPYQGGNFKLELFLPDDYPMCPPKVRFLTKIYHPNIDKLGRICLDTLKDKWTPALQIRHVLLSIMILMSAPNIDDPLAADIAEDWRRDPKKALQTAKDWTAKYAK